MLRSNWEKLVIVVAWLALEYYVAHKPPNTSRVQATTVWLFDIQRCDHLTRGGVSCSYRNIPSLSHP